MFQRSLAPFLLAIVCNTAIAQTNIIPAPVSLKMDKGSFTIDNNTSILVNGPQFDQAGRYLLEKIKDLYGIQLQLIDYKTSMRVRLNKDVKTIRLALDETADGREGAYTFSVTDRGVQVVSQNGSGIFYGIQTLLQLMPAKRDALLSIPQLSITDYPRFGYRGMHLDVGRHFFPVSFVKKYIDYLAYHKYNNFHWHLTEDQGWRIEIKKYPKLTQVGSCRAQTLVGHYGTGIYDGKPYCGFYTQEQIKEIVQYAAERYINVIPEIEMPGHSVAALASYPYLGCTKGPYKTMETWGVMDDVYCAGNDSTFNFLQDVLDEVMALFPSAYIHIGGDECPKEKWKQCAKCQLRIKENNLKDEHGLQSYFIQRIEKYVNSKGKKIIGWDEILEGGLAPNATVMSWRGEDGGIEAARQNHDVIMTPGGWCYLDHSQRKNEDSLTIGGYTTLEKVYGYEPVPAALTADQSKYILGAQGNVWTEYMEYPSKVEYMIFPRMSALSEVLWSPKEKRDWKNFETRIPSLFERYKLWGANYSNAYYDLEATVIPLPNDGVGWKLQTTQTGGEIIYTKGKDASALYNYNKPIAVLQSGEFCAELKNPNQQLHRNVICQSFFINKASGKKISLTTPPSKSYAGSGAFTLVDGIQNSKGMGRSSEFLGFNGTDLNAVIDLGKIQPVNNIILHAFEQADSWIYAPAQVIFYSSADGKNFTEIESFSTPGARSNHIYRTEKKLNARYIKVWAKNFGAIPSGKPGAGTPAWLFADEIEIN
ncbi:MAG: family 20 glycosylhydrolase [Ferruginibacter sp.]